MEVFPTTSTVWYTNVWGVTTRLFMVDYQGKRDGWGLLREAWWSLYGVAFTISLTVSA